MVGYLVCLLGGPEIINDEFWFFFIQNSVSPGRRVSSGDGTHAKSEFA